MPYTRNPPFLLFFYKGLWRSLASCFTLKRDASNLAHKTRRSMHFGGPQGEQNGNNAQRTLRMALFFRGQEKNMIPLENRYPAVPMRQHAAHIYYRRYKTLTTATLIRTALTKAKACLSLDQSCFHQSISLAKVALANAQAALV
jgi:hypothetical protein